MSMIDPVPRLPNPHFKGWCKYKMKTGWWCSRRRGHIGPCALHPRWWNLKGQIVMRKRHI